MASSHHTPVPVETWTVALLHTVATNQWNSTNPLHLGVSHQISHTTTSRTKCLWRALEGCSTNTLFLHSHTTIDPARPQSHFVFPKCYVAWSQPTLQWQVLTTLLRDGTPSLNVDGAHMFYIGLVVSPMGIILIGQYPTGTLKEYVPGTLCTLLLAAFASLHLLSGSFYCSLFSPFQIHFLSNLSCLVPFSHHYFPFIFIFILLSNKLEKIINIDNITKD